MPRDSRSTSRIASDSLPNGHMRQPPHAGPSAVEWMAMKHFRPVAASKKACTDS
jgi:hypothetical protein